MALNSGHSLLIRGAARDPYLKLNGMAIEGDQNKSIATRFIIIHVDSANHEIPGPLASGDLVQFRTDDAQPANRFWLVVARNGGPVCAVRDDKSASQFRVVALAGDGSDLPTAAIDLGRPVAIRGTEADPWWKIPKGGGLLFSDPDGTFRSTFVFE